MKAPVFAHGSLAELQSAIQKGKIKYPAYCLVYDTLQYAFVNKQQEIELVGIPKHTGNVEYPLILSELGNGVHLVSGSYKMARTSETVNSSIAYFIVLVDVQGTTTYLRTITASEISDFVIDSEGTASKTGTVVTTDYLDEKGYTTEEQLDIKIEALKVSIEEEMKEYVDATIEEQITTLVPEEVQKYVQVATEDDVRDLFSV